MSEVVTMDALDYIASFCDECFDMILLDPDYQDWNRLLERGILDECMRVLKKDGNILCFTKQPFDFNVRKAADKWFRREIVWTFENGGAWCSPKMPLISSQKIFWLVKSKDFYFNPRTGMEYSSKTKDFKRKTKVFGDYEKEGRNFKKSDEGVWLRDHLHFNKPMCGKIPAKPKQLIEVLIRCFCRDGGKLLDPFVGSGVTLQVCSMLSVDGYCCDIKEERVLKVLENLFENTVEC